MGDINWMYRETMGIWWEAGFIPCVLSIVNLITNIILVKLIGLPGALMSTILAISLINFPWSSRGLFYTYFKSKSEWFNFLIRTVIYLAKMTFVSFLTGRVCTTLPGKGFDNLIFRGIICSIQPNIILFVLNLMNPQFIPAGKFVIKMVPQRIIPSLIKRYFA